MIETFYCIYEGKNLPISEASVEHVIPMSVGGTNQFTIKVSRSINSILGNYVDGELTKDPFIHQLRLRHNLKGRSKKNIKNLFIKGTVKNTEIPIGVIYHSEGYSIIAKKNKDEGFGFDTSDFHVNYEVKYNYWIRNVFVAKSILAAGFFIYNQTFVDHADHNSLRVLMNYRKGQPYDKIETLPLAVNDAIAKLEEKDTTVSVSELMCVAEFRAIVIFKILDAQRMKGIIGLCGEYLGSITFNADTSKFTSDTSVFHIPNNPTIYEEGHVVGINKEGMLVMSYKEMYDIVMAAVPKE